jgi:hypothetical protein
VMTGIVGVLGVVAYLIVRPKVLAAEDRLEADPTSIDWSQPVAEPKEPV